MKLSRLVLFLLILSLVLPAGNSRAEPLAPGGDWTYVRPGIDWQKFDLNDPRPIEIFVARMDRDVLSSTMESAIAQGSIAEGRETISGMASRYDGAVNYWGQEWGNRNDVAVAINGYFFDRDGGTGVPWSGVLHSGWYAHRYTDNIGDAGFAWTHERQAFIGSCVYHTGNNNEVLFENAGSFAPNIDAINVARDDEEFIVFTPQFNANTGTDANALELLVEMSSPNQILPKPAGAVGYIRQIRNGGPTPLYHDYVVLSFWGDKKTSVQNRINGDLINVGDRVTISQEITDCAGLPTQDWTKTYAGLGGDYHFLTDGVIRSDFSNPDAGVPNSRTAVAYNDDYVYFVVVDGFRPDSRGLNIGELGSFLKNNPAILATDAVSLDSGTSSTMVVDGAVVNNTQCNFYRNCGWPPPNSLEKPPQETVLDPALTYKTEWDNPTGSVEPLVGTAFLLVSVEPISQSQTFTDSQQITTIASTAIRLGPGTNYASLGTLPSGASGEVIDEINNLNGVLAKNGSGLSYWWFVDMGDLAGWVIEEALQGGSIPPGPPPIVFTDFQYMPAIARVALLAATTGQDVLHSASLPEPTPVPLPGPNQR